MLVEILELELFINEIYMIDGYFVIHLMRIYKTGKFYLSRNYSLQVEFYA